MPRATQDAARLRIRSRKGLSPAVGPLSSGFRSESFLPRRGPTTPRRPEPPRFGLCPVRSPLLGVSLLFSLPPGTKMFQFPGFASAISRYQVFNLLGCPIRKSADQRSFAPTRGLSQLITSFIACESQGIRHAPFITFSHKKLGRIYFQHLSCDLLTLLSISSFAFAPTCQRSLREYGFCQLSILN